MFVVFSFFTRIMNLAPKVTCIILVAEGSLSGGVSDMFSAPTFDNERTICCSLSSFNSNSMLRNAVHGSGNRRPALADGGRM